MIRLTSKLALCLMLASHLTCCDRPAPPVVEGTPELEIVFQSMATHETFGACAEFSIKNIGTIPMVIIVDLTSKVNLYDQPIYERFVDGRWQMVEVQYAGGGLCSEILPGAEYRVLAPVDLISAAPQDDYRLIVADSNARLYHSNAFKIGD